MAKLTTTMCQVLTKAAIENLGQRKIYSIVDVLQEDPKKLAAISKLDFKDIVTLRQTLLTNFCPFPRQGLDAYNELLSQCSYLPSGIESFDKLLGGGFLTGRVYEVCGVSGSGKTQLCLTVATNVALKLKKTVHFVDTKLDFSGKRVHSILETKEPCVEIIGSTMEKILVTRVNSYNELYSFLYHLKNQLLQEPGVARMIIIESLPAVFFQYMGAHNLDSLGLLNSLASLIKYIAHEHFVSIVIVNLASLWVEEESAPLVHDENEAESSVPVIDIKPALGKYWAHIPNTRLYIEQCGNSNVRKITVMKSTHLSLGSFCNISVSSEGVK
ncbi:DNA repair protein RAD51-like protein 4 [Frankliniella fusca]|uniref:DNA repair protein RAD51-like protein 4 n=1 Tax=Frankliniella fusca TaxID=407009 RepID=A0AAE1LKK6_9NEOP|nr:DNA repair protein RAD51-like protein 4 [Frankliniella fusca]